MNHQLPISEPSPFSPASEEPVQDTYPVTVDGQVRTLTLDELIAAAETGLSRQGAAIRRNRAAGAVPNGQIYASFLEEYPDVRPEDIPPEVWEWAQQEGSLVSAFRKWELLTLRDELLALRQNEKNRQQQVGAARGDGQPSGIDPVTLALLGQ